MQWKVAASGTDSKVLLEPNPDLIIHGVSYAETASSASTAEIVIYHGQNASGVMIMPPVNFASDGFGPPHDFIKPLYCPNGIYLQRVSGETTVIVYYDISG